MCGRVCSQEASPTPASAWSSSPSGIRHARHSSIPRHCILHRTRTCTHRQLAYTTPRQQQRSRYYGRIAIEQNNRRAELEPKRCVVPVSRQLSGREQRRESDSAAQPLQRRSSVQCARHASPASRLNDQLARPCAATAALALPPPSPRSSRIDHACCCALTPAFPSTRNPSASHHPSRRPHPAEPARSRATTFDFLPPAHCGAVTHWCATATLPPTTVLAASICQLCLNRDQSDRLY